MQRQRDTVPIVLFILSVVGLAFGYGVVRGAAHQFPFSKFQAATKTWKSAVHYFTADYNVDYLDRQNIPAADIAEKRVVTPANAPPTAPSSAFLVVAGPQRFLEYCPDHGCLAVVLDRRGQLLHRYPYLPDEFKRGTLSDLPYEQTFMRADLDVTVVGALRMANDDLIVTFHFNESFPYGGGIARVNQQGKVVWYRRDYANHWASLTGPDEVAVIGGTITKHVVRKQMSPYHGFSIGCSEGYTKDTLEVLSLDGKLKQEIPLFDALLDSPFSNYLMSSVPSFSEDGTCDPIHSNFVRLVGAEIAALYSDVKPDDFLVSMRNLSSLGIVSRQSGKFTHLVRGTFQYQHSAQPIAGGKILLVDNLGGDINTAATRYLIVDPATGREQTLFPRPDTPKEFPTVTPAAGNIRVSDDGKVALIAVTYAGRAYEVSTENGSLMSVYDNLHDLRPTGLGEGPDRDRAARFKLWEVSFWN